MKKRQLIGILNITPDSYHEQGRFQDTQAAIEYGLKLFEQGADLVDIGGESTRPGSDVAVSEKEELKRVIPVIKGIRKKSSLPISIDTIKPRVAEAALDAGANWINDTTGFMHPEMRELARKSGAKCVVMHMLAPPHTLPDPHYPRGVVQEVAEFLQKRVDVLLNEGIDPSQIILDPGIGGGAYGKTPDQSLDLLQNIKTFLNSGYPVLIGISRKSFLQKILRKPASEVLSTTLALNTMALLEGVTYIRVHDVVEHRDILTVLERLKAINT